MNNELFNMKKFPTWNGYDIDKQKIEYLKTLWMNDVNEVMKCLYEVSLERQYFKEILLYIQRKLYMNEDLDLGLDSSKELFGIMITPLETLNVNMKELTLEDYVVLEKDDDKI